MNIVDIYYEQKEKLKELHLREFDDINLGYLLTDDIALFLSFGVKKNTFIKMIAEILISRKRYIFDDIKNDSILLFKSSAYKSRIDYNQMISNFKSIIKNTVEWREYDSFHFNGVKCFKLSVMAIQWNGKLKTVIPDKKERFFLIKQLLKCFKFYEQLKAHDDLIKKATCIVFPFDALDIENIFSQYCKKWMIPTVTLQHGHFHHTEKIDNNIGFISTPFEGFVSDFFFAWGHYTYLEALENGIPKEKIYIVGSLKNPMDFQKNSSSINDNFAVILNGTLGFEENERLMHFAKEIYLKYGMSYIVRPHPSKQISSDILNSEGFDGISNSKEESVKELASKVSFCLCGNSSVLTEFIFLEIPAISLHPLNSIDNYERLREISFKNEEELWQILDRLLNNKMDLDLVLKNNRQFIFNNTDIQKSYFNAIEKVRIHYEN